MVNNNISVATVNKERDIMIVGQSNSHQAFRPPKTERRGRGGTVDQREAATGGPSSQLAGSRDPMISGASSANDSVEVKGPFGCDQCSASFANQAQVYGHMKKHGKMECSRCSRRFAQEDKYNYHMVVDHAQEFFCRLCDFKSTRPQDVIAHILSHQELESISNKVFK